MKQRKLDTNLLFEDLGLPLLTVNEVLHYAAYDKPNAYGPRNWMEGGDEFLYELKAARHRHWAAMKKGEELDPDSGKPHRAHIIACDLFLLHFEMSSDVKHHVTPCERCGASIVLKVRPGQMIRRPVLCEGCT